MILFTIIIDQIFFHKYKIFPLDMGYFTSIKLAFSDQIIATNIKFMHPYGMYSTDRVTFQILITFCAVNANVLRIYSHTIIIICVIVLFFIDIFYWWSRIRIKKTICITVDILIKRIWLFLISIKLLIHFLLFN